MYLEWHKQGSPSRQNLAPKQRLRPEGQQNRPQLRRAIKSTPVARTITLYNASLHEPSSATSRHPSKPGQTDNQQGASRWLRYNVEHQTGETGSKRRISRIELHFNDGAVYETGVPKRVNVGNAVVNRWRWVIRPRNIERRRRRTEALATRSKSGIGIMLSVRIIHDDVHQEIRRRSGAQQQRSD